MTYVMTFPSVVEDRQIGQLAASPLRLALVQARTTPVLAFEQPAEVQRLVDALEAGWTVTDRQANREVQVALGPDGVRQQAGSPETVWVLTAADGATRAAVSASSVAVECDQYRDWEAFYAAVRQVFTAVEAVVAPARCTRLGVRYINELRDQRLTGQLDGLGELVNSALIAPALALGRPLEGSMAELRVRETEDGDTFALRHGLTGDGTYLLDLDAYREQPGSFDGDALARRAEAFHARIESVFAWALTDNYLEQLRGGEVTA